MPPPPADPRTYEARLAELAPTDLERGDLLRFLGRIDESERFFAAIAGTTTDAPTAASARIGLANALCARARWSEARQRLTGLADDPTLDPRLRARVHAIVASTHFNEHTLDAASAELDQALAIQRALRDREGEAISTTSLGIVAFARGDRSPAFVFLDEGRALAERVGLEHWAAMARSYLAMLRHEAGEIEAARAMYDESIAVLDRLGVRRAEGITLFGRAVLRFEQRELDGASDDWRDALAGERATSPDYEPLLVAALAIPAAARSDGEARDHQLRYARACAERRPRFAFAVDAIESVLCGQGTTSALRRGDTIEGRLLARALDAWSSRPRQRRLRVGEDAAWFSIESGPRVDLSRRRPLRRLLLALADQHRHPERPPLAVDALVRAGWPEERLVGSTGPTRLYNAVATLRKMGLEGLLERRGTGYALADDVLVVDTPR